MAASGQSYEQGFVGGAMEDDSIGSLARCVYPLGSIDQILHVLCATRYNFDYLALQANGELTTFES